MGRFVPGAAVGNRREIRAVGLEEEMFGGHLRATSAARPAFLNVTMPGKEMENPSR